MDLWHSAALGHRSTPALWARSVPQDGAQEEYLGDVRRPPASLQVFNACLFDKYRTRADQPPGTEAPALRLVSAPSPHASTGHARPRTSMRAYAMDRVEEERRLHEAIRTSKDQPRLLVEMQVCAARKTPLLTSRWHTPATNTRCPHTSRVVPRSWAAQMHVYFSPACSASACSARTRACRSLSVIRRVA